MIVRWLAALVLMVVSSLAEGAAPDPDPTPGLMQRWEHGGAQIQLSRVRTLTQRLSKQNLLYQLHLADVQKSDMVRTAGEVDAALISLRDGSPSLGVPYPPTRKARDAVDAVDEAWGPLRRLAVASAFDYVRRAGSASYGAGVDPLLIRHFDELAQDVDERASAAKQRYVEACETTTVPDCRAVAQATGSGPLSERMVKQAVLVFAGFEAEANTARLRESRARMGRTLELASTMEPVQSAMSPERGKVGIVVGGLWVDIMGNWDRLSRNVDLVLAGESERLDVGETVAAQQIFLDDLQRFSLAVQVFAANRRAAGEGPPQ